MILPPLVFPALAYRCMGFSTQLAHVQGPHMCLTPIGARARELVLKAEALLTFL